MPSADPGFWPQFLSDVISTVIGVVIGFLLSIWIHRIEINHDRKQEAQRNRERRALTLKHIMLSCATNIETALNFKSQMSIPLSEDIKLLQPQLEVGNIWLAIQVSETMKHMFQALPTVGAVPLPSQDDLIFITDEIPMVLALSTRLFESFSALNGSIELRNKYLEQQATRNIDGMTENAIKYYHTMLSSTGMNIVQSVDDILFFADILAEQIDNYSHNRFKGEKFVSFTVDSELSKHLPPKDYNKGFRGQFRDFSIPQTGERVGLFRHCLTSVFHQLKS